MNRIKEMLLFVVGLLVGFLIGVSIRSAEADSIICNYDKSKLVGDCLPLSEMAKLQNCLIPKELKCFHIPIKIYDDQGHEVDEEWGSSKCKHNLSKPEVKLLGIDNKDDRTVSSWIVFLNNRSEIKQVSINVYGPNYSIAETKRRIDLIIERMKDAGIDSSRLKAGRHVKAEESYIKIDILKIGSKDAK